MTITITKLRLGLVILVVALIAPATALATHVFDDVPDDEFYAGAVEWAKANGITTGTGPTTFEPDRGVTRGESVTFLKRYDDKIVQPALTSTYHASINADGTTRPGTTDGVTSANPVTGFYEIAFPRADIRGCIFQATLVGEPFGLLLAGPAVPDGHISLAEDFDGAFADTDSILVAIDDAANVATNYSFHLTVHC